MVKSLITTPLFISAALAGVISRRSNTESSSSLWQPKFGSKWQIVLNSVIDINKVPVDGAEIYDVDLFDTPKETIEGLKAKGKKVICYFSAGTSEDWREDYTAFQPSDKKSCMGDWEGERWLDVSQPNVFEIMKQRIALAHEKGCNAIDPDNLDGYSNEVGGELQGSEESAIAYMSKLAAEASKYGMSTGLKNAQSILPSVTPFIQFAVNEQCAAREECASTYQPLIQAQKPIFEIEYVVPTSKNSAEVKIDPKGFGNTQEEKQALKKWQNMSSSELKSALCLKATTNPENAFSTVLKTMGLDGYVIDCNSNVSRTATLVGTEQKKGYKDTECKGTLGL
jgi:hypothetical protein